MSDRVMNDVLFTYTFANAEKGRRVGEKGGNRRGREKKKEKSCH